MPPATTAVFFRKRINLPHLPCLSSAEDDTSRHYRAFLPRKNRPSANTVAFLRERRYLPQLPRLSRAKEDTSRKYRGFLPRKNKPPTSTLAFSRERRYFPQTPQLSPVKKQPERVTTNAQPAATTSLRWVSTPDRGRSDCSATAKCGEETSHTCRGIPPRRNKHPTTKRGLRPR